MGDDIDTFIQDQKAKLARERGIYDNDNVKTKYY